MKHYILWSITLPYVHLSICLVRLFGTLLESTSRELTWVVTDCEEPGFFLLNNIRNQDVCSEDV